jgi:hypothetical protein
MAMDSSMLSMDTNNWFYMDRLNFKNLLTDELGPLLTKCLIELDFDTAVSFMIGETVEEVVTKIQQSLSRLVCRRIICNNYCISCALLPSSYAKLSWFVQRLFIMSPISKPFVQRTFPPKVSIDNSEPCVCPKNDLHRSISVKNSTEPDFIQVKFYLYFLMYNFSFLLEII